VSSSTSIPSFGHRTSTKPSQPAIVPNPAICYTTPPTPDTPSCSHSTSSFSPPTPPDTQNRDFKIAESASSGTMSLASDVMAAHPALSISAAKHKGCLVQDPAASTPLSVKVPSKSKPGRDQYAFATRTVWWTGRPSSSTRTFALNVHV
jgi:hypothetical protein